MSRKRRSLKTISATEREGNRRRCAKYRAKRRALEGEVYRENVLLKRERAELVDCIVDLEYTINQLRGQASVDLRRENRLLRREIEVSFR